MHTGMRSSPHPRAGPWALVGLVAGCAPEPESEPIVIERSGAAVHGPARRSGEAGRARAFGLEAGALDSQDRTPVEQLTLVLDGYANAKRDVARSPEDRRQRRTLYFCAPQNVDFAQCVLFDGADAGAHLTGVEYVISEDLYKTLPPVERQYWHAHVGEVDSGILIAPGLGEEAHRSLMRELRSTYGKQWRTWDTERDAMPLGEPTLMWSVPPARLDPRVRTEMRSRRPQ